MSDFFNKFQGDQGNSGQPPQQITISDRTVPLDQPIVGNGVNSNKIVLNDDVQNVWTTGVDYNTQQDHLHLTDDAVIHIGDDFEVTAKEFKLMMKVLLKMAKDE